MANMEIVTTTQVLETVDDHGAVLELLHQQSVLEIVDTGLVTIINQGGEGTQGPAGPVGPAGPEGSIGPTGPTGPQGPPGSNGMNGTNGADGAQGQVGPIGPQGLQGPVGNIGPVGAQGPIGGTGPAGPGVPSGGSNGQVLKKNSSIDFDTSWQTDNEGGSSNSVSAVTPDAPVANTLTQMNYNYAGRGLPIFRNNSEAWLALQTSMARGQFSVWRPTGNGTTVPGVFGFAAMIGVGTATRRNVNSATRAARLKRLGYVSAATVGAVAGHYQSLLQTMISNATGDGGFFYVCRFVISDAVAVSGARMFVGLRGVASAPANVEPSTLVNTIGLAQLSTSTNLHIVFGGTTAQAPINLGADFPTSGNSANAYELTLYAPPAMAGVVHYRVERLGTTAIAQGQLGPGTSAVTLPAATTQLAHAVWRTNNATALAVGIDVASVYLEQME